MRHFHFLISTSAGMETRHQEPHQSQPPNQSMTIATLFIHRLPSCCSSLIPLTSTSHSHSTPTGSLHINGRLGCESEPTQPQHPPTLSKHMFAGDPVEIAWWYMGVFSLGLETVSPSSSCPLRPVLRPPLVAIGDGHVMVTSRPPPVGYESLSGVTGDIHSVSLLIVVEIPATRSACSMFCAEFWNIIW